MNSKQPGYYCTKCDAQFLKWSGQCPECGKWSTIVEGMSETAAGARPSTSSAHAGKAQSFNTLELTAHEPRTATGVDLWDRILSGGFVRGSVTLLGGEPGIGKSTLLAQLALVFAERGNRVLYVTGEESPLQVHLRLKRLATVIPSSFEFLDQTQADVIAATIRETKPNLTIIDSVQTMRLPDVAGEPGNPTQVRASAAVVAEAAKQTGCSIILVGQVTKEGELAGPRLLEHLVDSVLMMEGDRTQSFRLLRVVKHRFGNTEESGILTMGEQGLVEVLDPSAAFIADRPKETSGSVITCLMQGARPLLVEVQALVTPAGFGTPSRRVTGADANRLSLLLAVLGRRAGVGFGDQDVFVNAVGGVEAKDPSIDLAIALALASAKFDKPLARDVIAMGEVGLAGEIRPVARLALRLKEAARLGFKVAIVPKEKDTVIVPMMTVIPCGNIKEAIQAAGLR